MEEISSLGATAIFSPEKVDMCPEKPAFYINSIWEAIFASHYEFWWCGYYANAWYISLSAIVVCLLTGMLIYRIKDVNPPPNGDSSSAIISHNHKWKEMVDKVKPLWWFTLALLFVGFVSAFSLFTTVFPNWTIWALGTRDRDSIYALSYDGVQYVLDSLEWVATAGLLSFVSAVITLIAVVVTFHQQIFQQFRSAPATPDLGALPSPDAAKEPKEKVEPLKRKPRPKRFKIAPETEWTALSRENDSNVEITLYQNGRSISKRIGYSDPIRLASAKIWITREGLHIWADQKPSNIDRGYAENFVYIEFSPNNGWYAMNGEQLAEHEFRADPAVVLNKLPYGKETLTLYFEKIEFKVRYLAERQQVSLEQ